jgi:hypothetical protein
LREQREKQFDWLATDADDITSQSHSLFACSREKKAMWKWGFIQMTFNVPLQKNPSRSTVAENFHVLLSSIEDLHEKHEYHGSADRLFAIVAKCTTERPVGKYVASVGNGQACPLLVLMRSQQLLKFGNKTYIFLYRNHQ